MFVSMCKSGRHRPVALAKLWPAALARFGRGVLQSVNAAPLSTRYLGKHLWRHMPRVASSADIRQVQATWYSALTNNRSRKKRSPGPEDMEHMAGRFRESAQAPTRFFRMRRDRDTVDAAQNVVRSLLREIDEVVTRRKTPRSRSVTPWLKRRRSSSETTAAPIPPPQTALRLMHPPLPPTAETTSDANEKPTDFRQQLVASVPRCEPGARRHGFELTSLSTAALNGFFDVAERKGKAQFSHVHWPW